MVQEGGFLTALEYSDRRKTVFKVSTGSTDLEYVQNFDNNNEVYTIYLLQQTSWRLDCSSLSIIIVILSFVS